LTAQLSEDDKTMDVQLLVVPNCPNEQRAQEMLHDALAGAGAGDTPIRTVVVETAEQAEQMNFSGSPTILFDGADLFPSPRQSPGLACRMYAHPGGPRGVPEMTALIAAIRRAAAEPDPGAAVPCQDRRRGAAEHTAIDIAAKR